MTTFEAGALSVIVMIAGALTLFVVLLDGRKPTIITETLEVEHVGATLLWSPRSDIRAAPQVLELERELAAAEAELAPLLQAEHDALATAWRAFDAALLAPMRTAALWHQDGYGVCETCHGGHHDRDGHPLLRSFRTDTPTGEFPFVVIRKPGDVKIQDLVIF